MLTEELKPYQDRYGIVHDHPGNICRNALRYHSEALLVKALNGIDIASDLTEYRKFLDLIRSGPGLFNRYPGVTDQQGPDDYIALAHLASKYMPDVAEEMYVQGQNKTKLFGPIRLRYCYNNANPGTWHRSAWLGRFPAFICQLHWATNRRPPLWALAATVLTVLLSGSEKDQDTWVLSWHVIHTGLSKSWLMRLTHKLWVKRLIEYWPGEIRAVLTRYFGHEHPLAKYWPKESV